MRFFTIFLIFATLSTFSYSQETEILSENSSDTTTQETQKIEPEAFNPVAVIQALNKITAKTSLLEIKIGEEIKFGKLTIVAKKCWKSALDQKPDNKILLEVFENSSELDDAKKEKRIFYGWMISSSPSISGLEHPIYDIIAINCKK